jgi:hypothetical protein
VADASGTPVEPSVMPGQLVVGDQVFRALLDEPTRLEIHRLATIDSAPELLATLDFPHLVRGELAGARAADTLIVVALLRNRAIRSGAASGSGVRVRRAVGERQGASPPHAAGERQHQGGLSSVKLGHDGKIYLLKAATPASRS